MTKDQKEMLAVICFMVVVFGSIICTIIGVLLDNKIMGLVCFGILVLVILLLPFRGIFKKFACAIGWHCYSRQRIPITYDGASRHSECAWCHYQGMEDSQGNLF